MAHNWLCGACRYAIEPYERACRNCSTPIRRTRSERSQDSYADTSGYRSQYPSESYYTAQEPSYQSSPYVTGPMYQSQPQIPAQQQDTHYGPGTYHTGSRFSNLPQNVVTQPEQFSFSPYNLGINAPGGYSISSLQSETCVNPGGNYAPGRGQDSYPPAQQFYQAFNLGHQTPQPPTQSRYPSQIMPAPNTPQAAEQVNFPQPPTFTQPRAANLDLIQLQQQVEQSTMQIGAAAPASNEMAAAGTQLSNIRQEIKRAQTIPDPRANPFARGPQTTDSRPSTYASSVGRTAGVPQLPIHPCSPLTPNTWPVKYVMIGNGLHYGHIKSKEFPANVSGGLCRCSTCQGPHPDKLHPYRDQLYSVLMPMQDPGSEPCLLCVNNGKLGTSHQAQSYHKGAYYDHYQNFDIAAIDPEYEKFKVPAPVMTVSKGYQYDIIPRYYYFPKKFFPPGAELTRDGEEPWPLLPPFMEDKDVGITCGLFDYRKPPHIRKQAGLENAYMLTLRRAVEKNLKLPWEPKIRNEAGNLVTAPEGFNPFDTSSIVPPRRY